MERKREREEENEEELKEEREKANRPVHLVCGGQLWLEHSELLQQGLVLSSPPATGRAQGRVEVHPNSRYKPVPISIQFFKCGIVC